MKMKTVMQIFVLTFAGACSAATPAPREPEFVDKRLFAGWKVTQADGLGDVYYFYPDGLFVQQGVRRREFVTIGRWIVEEQKRLVLSDIELKNTSLSKEELAKVKSQKLRYLIALNGPEKMRWAIDGDPTRINELQRIRDLPDRTENAYWGLGTHESYDRAISP